MVGIVHCIEHKIETRMFVYVRSNLFVFTPRLKHRIRIITSECVVSEIKTVLNMSVNDNLRIQVKKSPAKKFPAIKSPKVT